VRREVVQHPAGFMALLVNDLESGSEATMEHLAERYGFWFGYWSFYFLVAMWGKNRHLTQEMANGVVTVYIT
jgi:hypothetical protein